MMRGGEGGVKGETQKSVELLRFPRRLGNNTYKGTGAIFMKERGQYL